MKESGLWKEPRSVLFDLAPVDLLSASVRWFDLVERFISVARRRQLRGKASRQARASNDTMSSLRGQGGASIQNRKDWWPLEPVERRAVAGRRASER